ncbi:Ferulic acid decarboxylase 1 [subsurface metagenome]
MGLPTDAQGADLVRAYRDKLKKGIKLIPPVKVDSGPVKENILVGDEVDLYKFPSPKWHELDGGRYIGTGDCVIIRDPEENWINLGTYRLQIHDKATTSIRIGPNRDGYLIARKYWEKGLSCPVAVSCGQEPLLFAAAGWRRVPWGVSEYDFAGGLGNKPVQVTPGVITDLPIPATAEVVLEGDLISPEIETLTEGPFGEWPGYYNGPFQEPVFRVRAIVHRNNPIIQGAPPSRFPGVWSLGNHLQRAASLWNDLDKNMPGVRGVRVVEDASVAPIVVISLKQEYEGQAKQAALLAAGSSSTGNCLRFVIVVDEDINPFNTSEVLWALGTRCEPEIAIDVIRGCVGLHGVAWESPENRRLGISAQSTAIILACKPYHWIKQFPPAVKSSQERLNATREKWGNILWT